MAHAPLPSSIPRLLLCCATRCAEGSAYRSWCTKIGLPPRPAADHLPPAPALAFRMRKVDLQDKVRPQWVTILHHTCTQQAGTPDMVLLSWMGTRLQLCNRHGVYASWNKVTHNSATVTFQQSCHCSHQTPTVLHYQPTLLTQWSSQFLSLPSHPRNPLAPSSLPIPPSPAQCHQVDEQHPVLQRDVAVVDQPRQRPHLGGRGGCRAGGGGGVYVRGRGVGWGSRAPNGSKGV